MYLTITDLMSWKHRNHPISGVKCDENNNTSVLIDSFDEHQLLWRISAIFAYTYRRRIRLIKESSLHLSEILVK